MKEFKCVVTRTDEYIVQLDDSVLDEEWMEHFRRYFYGFKTLSEHAEHIAQFRSRTQVTFIEGYGTPKVDGKPPCFFTPGTLNEAINIKIVSEDKDIEVQVEEIAEGGSI